jgi:di/tricarboxylate transporter
LAVLADPNGFGNNVPSCRGQRRQTAVARGRGRRPPPGQSLDEVPAFVAFERAGSGVSQYPGSPDSHAIAVMALTVSAFYLFSRERISLESSGLAVLTVLVVGFEIFPYSGRLGQVEPTDFLAGFGNPALIAIVALLVCSKALEVTGALHTTTQMLARLWRRSPRIGLLTTMFVAALASMFMNNTPLVAMILPVVVAVCVRTETPLSGALMPIGFATIVGGMATTIGTSTNLLVTDLSARLGIPHFDMFDFALPVLVAGSASLLLMWLIAPRVLPNRSPPMADAAPRIFRGVLHVTGGSAAAGRTVADIRAFAQGRIHLDRIERGDNLFIARLPTTVVREGDRLYVHGQSRRLKELETLLGTPLSAPDAADSASARTWLEETSDQRLVEIVVTTASSLYGQTLAQSRLLEQFDLVPIAVHAPKDRAGDDRHELRGVDDLRLRAGDVVLVQGDSNGINALKQTGQVLVLDSAIDLPHTARAGVAAAIMGGVVVFAAFGVLPIVVSSLIGVLLCIATRTLHWRQLRAAIDTNIVVMIVAALALGEALTVTGATAWLANLFILATGGLPPAVVVAVLMLSAALLTEVVTNNAVAVLLTPLAFSVAEGLGMDARPLVLAVMFGANMSFLTPIGYQTNLMVMNAGGYRFTDFLRLGLPLQLFIWPFLSWLLAMGVGAGA